MSFATRVIALPRLAWSTMRWTETVELKTQQGRMLVQRVTAPVQNLSRRTKIIVSIFGTATCTLPFAFNDNRIANQDNTNGNAKETPKTQNSPFDLSFYKNPINGPTVKVMAVNLAVFLAWQIPVAQPFLMKHFALSLNNVVHGRIHTLLTCCFSHSGLFHFMFNQIALSSFGAGGLVDRLRHYRSQGSSDAWNDAKNDWWTLYLGAGVSSSMASLVNFIARKNYYGSSIGASGSVIGMLFSYAHNHPDATFGIIGLPFINFSAATGAKALLAFDIGGLILNKGKLDHAGHLGGALAGLASEAYRSGSFYGTQNLLFKF